LYNLRFRKEGADLVPVTSRSLTEYGELYAKLTINKIKRDEGGVFVVTAENEVGKADATFTIRVLDVPLPPENLQACEVSSYSCKLTWSPPKDDGNAPITGYIVERYDSKRAAYTRVDKTILCELFIDKLVKGQSYQFRVLAENRIGTSEPCEMKDPIVAKSKNDVPSAPGIPEISDITATSCRVSWEAPRNDGGLAIKGYYVERRSGNKWIRLSPNGSKQPITERFMVLKDLVEGNDYEFRVCAVNDEGESAFSRASDLFTAQNRFKRPDPPIDMEVSEVTKSSCLLTWRPPVRDGGMPIIRYHVEMRTKGEYKFTRFTDDFISECEYKVSKKDKK
jgi:titin